MTGMTRQIHPVILLAALSVAGGGAHASGNDLVLNPAISQSDFNTVVDELGSIAAYNPIGPAASLGVTGLDLGLSLSSYKINRSAWDFAVRDGSAPSRLTMSRLHARKGLPYGVDIGAAYSMSTSGNISVLGGEVRKALLEGTPATPAVSLSGHYSLLTGVNDLDLSAYGIDLGISKGFTMFTPYAGIGQIWYDGSESVDAITQLSDRNTSQTRSYFGMRMGLLPFMSVTAQADFAEVNSYSLRLNLGF
jgi:hypothetical protein